MRKVKAAEVGRGLVQAKGQRASGFIPLGVDTGFLLGSRESRGTRTVVYPSRFLTAVPPAGSPQRPPQVGLASASG